jgi:hypothetical protein
VIFTLNYGNQGGAQSNASVLTFTLPLNLVEKAFGRGLVLATTATPGDWGSG